MDAEEYRGKMDNVLMATRSKMPWFHKDSGKPEAGRVLYIQQDGARVLIAPMAQMFLFGTEIDYEVDLLQSGFKFRNPNVAEACGCGESIKFKDQPDA